MKFGALHTLFESSRYEYSFIFLYMSAWKHLAKTFILREQIKATSKQACYCSTAWVPASKKQIDDYLAAAVKENCKFSENFFFFLVLSALMQGKPKVKLARLRLLASQGASRAERRGWHGDIS